MIVPRLTDLTMRLIRPAHRFAGAVRRFARDTGGGVMIWTGLGLPVILGISGLGLDSAMWYLERRTMQSVVDTAAISAALTKAGGGDQDAINAAVAKALADNKFTLITNDDLQVNVPPLTGPNTTNTTAVEVVIRRKATLFLSQILYTKAVHIRTRAVAGGVPVGQHCIVALDHDADSAVLFTGTADANIDCGVASNSESSRAIHVGGKAVLKADPAQAYGDIYVEGTATLETTHPPQPRSPRVPDPFGPEGRDLQMPLMAGACTPAPDLSGSSGTINLSPGLYCGDLLIENKTVNLAPGVYILDEGDLRVKAGSIVAGDGVTFILTGSNPSQVGIFEITSNSQFNVTPPTSGDYAGIVIYTDQAAASNDGNGNPFTNYLYGGASMAMKGAIYSPSRKIEFTGGSGSSSPCLYVVGRLVTVTGNAIINNDNSVCESLGLKPIEQVRIKLIE
ncbi:MAG: pilus assembly protein TadG-related protein [Alphaproteobacteria bacterium]